MKKKKVKCAVPQGTILGPLLFTIYMNDMLKKEIGRIIAFADHIVFLYTGRDWIEALTVTSTILNDVLNKLVKMQLSNH